MTREKRGEFFKRWELLVGEGTRPRGRPGRRWNDGVEGCGEKRDGLTDGGGRGTLVG